MTLQFSVEENPGSESRETLYRRLDDLSISSLILGEEQGLTQNLERAARTVDDEGASTIYCAHWAGDAKPAIAANQIAFLDDRLFGRLGLRITERADGTLSHEAVWRRIDEYLTVLKRLWSNTKPIDHEGEFYSVTQGFVANKGPQGALLPIRMSGMTGTAVQVCARHATTFDVAYAPCAEVGPIVQKLREAASRFGRANAIRFALRLPAEEIEQKPDIQSLLQAYADLGISEFILDIRSIAALEPRSHILKLLLGRQDDQAPKGLAHEHFGRTLRRAN